jgi:hypothetical protein
MMSPRRFWPLYAGLSLLSAAPLAAQEPPPEPQAEATGSSITVTGERESDRSETRREAARFFDSHAVETRIGQLARWHEPICARTGGLPPELAVRVATRIMDIAESVGAPVNRAERCRPNVRIGFTDEPQEMVERAYRRNRLVIGFHYAARRGEVMEIRQPVQAWYVTKTRALPTGGGFDRANPQIETIDDARVRPPSGAAGSRFTSGLSSRLVHVLILADTNIVAGQQTDAIAELLAFLALAQTPVAEACDQAVTILNLMNPACPPEQRPAALTEADLAYLRALYSSDPEAGERLQRGNIVQHMTNELTGEQ